MGDCAGRCKLSILGRLAGGRVPSISGTRAPGNEASGRDGQ